MRYAAAVTSGCWPNNTRGWLSLVVYHAVNRIGTVAIGAHNFNVKNTQLCVQMRFNGIR